MFITLPNAKLFSTAFGRSTAPAFLALSGWIGSWEDWLEPLALLSAHYHTISYDHRGSGITIAPLASITFDQLVDDVFTILDAFAPK
jgi:pimeloyl-ACP methyl ester carboxylesterase